MYALLTPKRAWGAAAMLLLAVVASGAAGAAATTTAATVPPGVTPEAQGLADAAGLSAKGRAIYFAARPTVDDRTTFASHCPQPETPDSYLLGCYTPGAGRIYLLRIERPELASGMAVTAAHEMLHAAHRRLSARQLAKLEPLLEFTYGSSGDQTLHDEVDAYPQHDRLDEIYARLGTEVGDLPPQLEQHYAKYFANRPAVVAATAAYRRVFDDLDAQLDQINADLAALEHEGDDLRARFEAAGAEADRLGAQITSLRAQGRYDESNQLVDPANAATDEANALVDAYNGVVDRHNALVDAYNSLALSNQQLVESLKPVAAG